jgi:predicted nucleic acid-binding protein
MNGGSAFFDTNVLLYMYGGDSYKRALARQLFTKYASAGRILLSTQVVQEFYVAGSRKLGMPRAELRDTIAALLDLPLVILGAPHITSAIRNEETYKISFWDGLILAAAESAGAEVLYTEDLNDGQQYGPVLARNPFRSPEEPAAATLT